MKFIKSILNKIMFLLFVTNLKKNIPNFAKTINNIETQYCKLKIINLNKYLTRSVQGVLYLFNYDKIQDITIDYFKYKSVYSQKTKFTSPLSIFDYEDYKKIIFYDDLYETYTKQFLYWEMPDGNPTEPLIKGFVSKVESYPSVKLKQIKNHIQ